MRYLGEHDINRMMGLGYYGEVRQGPDGNLYQWMEGYDGLGNPVGFWKKLKRLAKKALPIAQNFIPGGTALTLLRSAPVQNLLRRAVPIARQVAREAGVTGYEGLGALYQAPDGTVYQVQGFAADDELRGFDADEELQGWGLAVDDELDGWGLGALYQAPDGALYQVQGFADDAELRGFADDELRGFEDDELRGFADDELRGFEADEELRGFAADDELRGFEDDELRGFEADEELRGFAADEELRSFEADEELHGLYGYVQQDGVSGLDAFVPDQPASTPWFTPPGQSPEMWRPLW
jgi:hypothetical protein